MTSKKIFTIAILFLISVISFACTKEAAPKPDLQIAADNMRFPVPDGNVPDNEITSSIKIELINDYPIWNPQIKDSSIRLIFHNTSKHHLGTQSKALLYIYDYNEKTPLYWTVLDLAFGKTATPGTLSIVSLPIGASKELAVPILDTIWADVSIKTIPHAPFYQIVSEGKYLMRFEMELYDEQDKPIDTAVSNFIEFVYKQ
jgi:hypothetical protein